MKKGRLYNKFYRVVGSVEYDGKCYYNVCLYNNSICKSLTFGELCAFMDDLDLMIDLDVVS